MKALFKTLICFITVSATAQSYVPQWNDNRIKVQPAIEIGAYAFNPGDVQLLESPFTSARAADMSYLLKIEPDRLLSDFRGHAGLKPKAQRYGGWESSGLAGHSLGHYLSACAMAYAATKKEEFLQRVNYMVNELAECQKARGTGYLGAIPKEDSMWAEVAKGNIRSRGFDLDGAWSPWYTVHKIMGGLLDAWLYCQNAQALKIDQAMADWTGEEVKGLNDSLMQKMLGTEYGGMNDALVNTYAFTGNKKYLDLSYRFYDRRVLDTLALKIDALAGKHSNTQIPKIIGSARRYQLTGDKKDLDIASFFWETITHYHSYANGGNSNYEYLGDPGKLNDFLSDNTTETCNTYNMLKLTGELFSIHPSASLMDFYEKALYNHILASQNHETGMMTYFVSLRMGGRKRYSDEFNTFTCCVGTGMENHVKYGENIYYRGKDNSLYINLFIPSVLNWKERGLTIRQETNIPASDNTIFTITTSKASRFPIRIRKPHWATRVQVKVNGTLLPVTIGEDGYLVLDRSWSNNDKIEFITPAGFYTESMPDNPGRRALFFGPDLLAGVLGDKEPQPGDLPVFVTTSQDANQWIKPLDRNSLVFQTANLGAHGDVKLIPFSRTGNEYYSVYWDVFTPDQWVVQQKAYEEEKRKQKELEDRTTDILRVGEMQPERDHDFVSEKSFTGDGEGKKWRMAREGGSFSFTMKTDPTEINNIICTYWGTDNRSKTFDIFVNDTKVATEDLNKFRTNKFYYIGYPIPKELTASRTSVTVKFVPKEHNTVGPVYGIRMAKGDITSLTTPLKNESIYR
ncbi:MAG TPA: beta-L-arabinofuranosidase domain-containing protein [Puia sp.]|nr:beta-L-arabinofuranosidase domain-containing protein [Puia sp.]